MPLTPIAVSAWRTSSSLKGLIMATTSFMVWPSFPGLRKVGHGLIGAPDKSGIFRCEWHKKLQTCPKTIAAANPPPDSPCSGTGSIRQNADPLSAVLLPTHPFQHLKGMICPTDPGFMLPPASNRALIPTP